MATALDKKIRRRIKRFAETGISQARVRLLNQGMIFEYAVKHHNEIRRYKMAKSGRLYRVN